METNTVVHINVDLSSSRTPKGRKISESRRNNNRYFSSVIAGVNYHNTDIKSFVGYVKPDPTNEFDKNAIGVYEHDGTFVGYLPKKEQERYNRWKSDENSMAVIGYIYKFFQTKENRFMLGGHMNIVKIYDDEEQDARGILEKEYRKTVKHLDYITENMRVPTTPRPSAVAAAVPVSEEVFAETQDDCVTAILKLILVAATLFGLFYFLIH